LDLYPFLLKYNALPVAAESPCPRLPVSHSTSGITCSTCPEKGVSAFLKPALTYFLLTSPNSPIAEYHPGEV
jgi:hypothetical protein